MLREPEFFTGASNQRRTAIRQGIYLLVAPFRGSIAEETETWNSAAKCSVLWRLQTR